MKGGWGQLRGWKLLPQLNFATEWKTPASLEPSPLLAHYRWHTCSFPLNSGHQVSPSPSVLTSDEICAPIPRLLGTFSFWGTQPGKPMHPTLCFVPRIPGCSWLWASFAHQCAFSLVLCFWLFLPSFPPSCLSLSLFLSFTLPPLYYPVSPPVCLCLCPF